MLRARKELAFALGFASTLLWSGAWSPDADAAVGDPDTVTCAYPVWVGFGPVHLANELGYFADEGITVVEILDDDMPNAVAAMERGDIDCYLRTVGEYQGLGRRKDTQGIIIGTIDVSTGGDGWAADRADPVGVRPQGQDHRGRAEPAGAPAAAGGAEARVQSVDRRHQSLRHRRGRRGRRVRQPRCGRGRHLRAGAQPGGLHPSGPRRPHRRVVEGLRGPDPRHHHGAHRRAGRPSRQVRQVPARDLPRDRLLLCPPGRVDPDHRQPLLDHAGGVQGDAAQLPLHALRGGARGSSARPTSRAASTRSSARPWR